VDTRGVGEVEALPDPEGDALPGSADKIEEQGDLKTVSLKFILYNFSDNEAYMRKEH
jgi:hypothetical protein